MKLVVTGEFKWLDFDCESRPLSFLGGDYTTAEITAIAASWIGEKKVHCWALGEVTTKEMLAGFMELYDQAGGVTGHNIRRFDLPLVNGALIEQGMAPLSAKLTSDTYGDLTKRQDISGAQASLAGMLGIPEAKYHMTQPAWREANRLTEAGITLTKKRVIDDVVQHKALRERMMEAGILKGPRQWRP